MKTIPRYLPWAVLVPVLAHCTTNPGSGSSSAANPGRGTGGSGGARASGGFLGGGGSNGGSAGAGAAGELNQAGEAGTGGGQPDVPSQAPLVPPIPTPRALGEVPESEVFTSIHAWHTFRPALDRARC
jgi:hypothetical protein